MVLKIVLEKERAKVYVDGVEVSCERLPDYLPIYVFNVAITSQAVVMEGAPWYGEEDDQFFETIVKETGAEKAGEASPLLEARSDTGNIIARNYRDFIEFEIRYGGKLYRVRYGRSPALIKALTPHLMSLHVLGRLDDSFISFIYKEMRSKAIREFLKKSLSRQ